MKETEKPNWLTVFGVDVSKIVSFPDDWDSQIKAVSSKSSVDTLLDGESDTSLEGPGTFIPVKVVMGDVVQSRLPWLYNAYAREFLEFSSESFERKLHVCNAVDDAVNINTVYGNGGRYEWHVDTNPVTGLLFVETLSEEEGGALVFKKFDTEFRIIPKRGMFYCFDARNVPHRVEPLKRERTRISVPMNYYLNSRNTGRADELNRYLRRE